MIKFFNKYWKRSFRVQLVIGITFIYMIVLVSLTLRTLNAQADFFNQRSIEQAKARVAVLAINSSSWVLANDYIGLQELIDSFKVYDDIVFAAIIGTDAKVLAHTDKSLIGKYVSDAISLENIKSVNSKNLESKEDIPKVELLSYSYSSIDVATPIYQGKRPIGIARVSLSEHEKEQKINQIIQEGVIFLVLALLLGVLFAVFITHGIAKELSILINTAREIRLGNRKNRAQENSVAEVQKLAHEFNLMLDTLNEHEHELVVTQQKLKDDIFKRQNAEKELNSLNDNLEIIVQERTQELLVQKEKAEQANQSKSIFLANMSHELRTPLNAILGFSQIMVDAPETTPEQKENLKIIEHSGIHLLALINDVLDMSKIEAGRMELEESSFNLKELIIDIANMMKVRSDEKNLQFHLEMDSDIVEYITSDAKKLRQILINIIGNAIKYTKEGGVSLRVQCKESQLSFEIEDSGRGMSKEELAVIFDPFVQVSSSKSVTEGTGLGLSITYRFLQLMDAKIDVKSELNNGTLFSFTLPVRVAKREDIEDDVAVDRVVALEEGSRIYRILIVEDQKENRLLLKSLLTSVGFEVYEAINGQVALDNYEKIKPDFIWMDMRMPVMDGYETTKAIRKFDKDVIIVALTASVFKEQKPKIIGVGCNDVMHKPYRNENIFTMMKKYLDVHYVYQTQSEEQENGDAIALHNRALNTLTSEAKERLSQALIRLNSEEIIQEVEEIQKRDKKLGNFMMKLVKNYEYETLLNLLEKEE